LLLEKWPFVLLAIASCVVTVFAQHSGQAVASLAQVPLGFRLANAMTAYFRYLAKTFWPTDLAVLYPFGDFVSPGWGLAAAFGLIAISVMVWQVRRRAPYLLVGWLWFVGTLVPVIGLVKVGSQALADRYTYVPLIGIFVMIAYGGADLAKRLALKPAMLAAFNGLVLGACAYFTMRQVRFWRDSETLFAHAVAVTRNNGTAHLHLADALARKGKNEQALGEYYKALQFSPNLSQVHNNLGSHLKLQGRVEESLAYFENALRLEPNVAQYHSNLGDALVKLRSFDKGLAQFAEAARLEPSSPVPHFLMGRTEMRRGLSTKAIGHFQDALRLDPDDVDSLTFLARVLAADQNPAIRDGAKAVALAEHANETSGGMQPFVLDTLAMAYAETGRFDLAQMAATNAIAFATANCQTNLASSVEEHLKLFQNRLPYREMNSSEQNP
jgi:tetratricopeptide (TPR) repeat protein